MTSVHVGLFSWGFVVLVQIVGFAVIWGKLSQKIQGIEGEVKKANKVLYPDPGSSNRLITLMDCSWRASNCWEKLNARHLRTDGTLKDALEERKGLDQKLDNHDRKLDNHDVRISTLEAKPK